MSRFETTFRNAVANAERDVLVEQIRGNPQMSLSELGKLTTGELGPLLRNLTVGDLLRSGAAASVAAPTRPRGAGKRSRGGAKAPKEAKEAKESAPKAAKAAKAGVVDTRSAAGRERFDQTVLAAIKAAASPISAEELRGQIGGTPLQARSALARLINAGKVTWEGKARGTRYSLVEG